MAAVQGCLEEGDKERRAKALEHKAAQARIKKLQEDVRTARGQLTQLRVRLLFFLLFCGFGRLMSPLSKEEANHHSLYHSDPPSKALLG